MSGTGSDNGWLEAAVAWEVCASLHRQYCKGKDALFTTRQSDFVKHAENARVRASRAQAPAGADVRRSDLVPGVMHCAKCKFQLNRVTLCVSDGNAYAGNNETEPCPNGCGPLWPVTWEQEARNCWKALEEMHERLHPAPTTQADSQPALDRDRIREIFMAHGFTVKEGQTDLKQYVYDAADALLRTARAQADSVLEDAGGANWQDISTAPKDGTRFVAVGNNYGLYSETQHTCIAQWFRGCWMEVSDWNEASELKYLTHWMPLPPLPGSAASAPAESALVDATRKQGGAT